MTDTMFIQMAGWVGTGFLALVVLFLIEEIRADFRSYRAYKEKEDLNCVVSKAFGAILIAAFCVKFFLALLPTLF